MVQDSEDFASGAVSDEPTPPRGKTFNAETAELAEQHHFVCGFREFCVDRRG
jgi:hypothetical protein